MENVIRRLRDMRPDMGLYANHYNVQSGATVSRLVTFGATADSFYEYLLKAWIQVCACTRVHVGMSTCIVLPNIACLCCAIGRRA